MPVNNLIQLRRGADWSSNPILASGEPGFDIINNVLKIGDGITPWSGLSPVNSGISSNWYDEINSGYVNITGINITGITIPGGYSTGRLDLFLNGVKLVYGTDFTATNGSDAYFYAAPASGSTVQYLTLYPGHASFLSNIVEDTSPQLGGNLDLNSFGITGVGNIITNSGNFTHLVINNEYALPTGDGSAGYSLVTDGNGQALWSGISGVGSSSSLNSNDVMDIISTGIIAGSGIDISYDNNNHELTISVNNALLYYLT